MADSDEDILDLLAQLNRPMRRAIPGLVRNIVGVALEDLNQTGAVGVYREEWGCVYFLRERQGWTDAQYHALAERLVKDLTLSRQMN